MLPAPGAMMPGPRGVWWRSHWFRRVPRPQVGSLKAAGWTAGRYGIGSIATTREVLRGLPGAPGRGPLLDAARKAVLAAQAPVRKRTVLSAGGVSVCNARSKGAWV